MRIAASVAFASAVLALPAAADEWKQSYPGRAGATVRVRTEDASVAVRGWNRDEIAAEVHTIGYTLGTGPDDVKVVDRKLPDGVEIEVVAPRTRWGWHMGRREIRVELQVPHEVALRLKTADGSVRADGLKGKIDIETSDGSMDGTDLAGDLQLRTADGSIRMDRLAGAVRAHTADGSVLLSGRFDRLEASTADGSIRADADAGSRLAAPWTLRTADGSIILAVPRDISANVEASTDDGSVSSDLPLDAGHREGRKRLSGRLNGGGPLLSLETTDGSIRLRGR
jgi:hypothetical protein